MRIWDQIAPDKLCRQHLLGEHRELHAIWGVILSDGVSRSPYGRHPEVKRWVGYESALAIRHGHLVKEMERRGFNHKSPLKAYNVLIIPDDADFPPPWDNQLEKLRAKECECDV